MKKISPGLSVVAGALLMTACASDTENVPIHTQEETKLSSDSIMTEKNTESETAASVDLDPKDQNKTLLEILQGRSGF